MKVWLVMALGIALGAVHAQQVTTYVPPKCAALVPVISKEAKIFLPSLSYKGYFGSLVEVESCSSLTHSRCCSPISELKTQRERGIGLGQLTVAWDSAGNVRFDSLAEMKNKYKQHLGELSWDTLKDRPDLQVRTMILMQRDNYAAFPSITNEFTRWAFADSAYNGGLGNVRKARIACGLAAKCHPDRWQNNVENYLPQSRKPLYGTRSAFDINRSHVEHVMSIRLPKYQKLYDHRVSP